MRFPMRNNLRAVICKYGRLRDGKDVARILSVLTSVYWRHEAARRIILPPPAGPQQVSSQVSRWIHQITITEYKIVQWFLLKFYTCNNDSYNKYH